MKTPTAYCSGYNGIYGLIVGSTRNSSDALEGQFLGMVAYVHILPVGFQINTYERPAVFLTPALHVCGELVPGELPGNCYLYSIYKCLLTGALVV